jgi:hypothetical protein
MNLREKLDPHLHVLRAMIRTIPEGQLRSGAESARHNLYRALEEGDRESAGKWLDALRVVLDILPQRFSTHTKATMETALRAIAGGIQKNEAGSSL